MHFCHSGGWQGLYMLSHVTFYGIKFRDYLLFLKMSLLSSISAKNMAFIFFRCSNWSKRTSNRSWSCYSRRICMKWRNCWHKINRQKILLKQQAISWKFICSGLVCRLCGLFLYFEYFTAHLYDKANYNEAIEQVCRMVM